MKEQLNNLTTSKSQKKQLSTKYVALILTAVFLIAFVIYIILLKNIDIVEFYPADGFKETVGFGSFNLFFRDLISPNGFYNDFLYKLTDYGSFIMVIIGCIYFVIGLVELIKRKSFFKVDANIIALGVFYVFVGFTYLIFQFLKINYRPWLIDGKLEASFPSSTTILAICLLLSSIDQTNKYIKIKWLRIFLASLSCLLSILFVIGRIFSGVHWISDIIGGLIISASLLSFYYFLKELFLDLLKQRKLSE